MPTHGGPEKAGVPPDELLAGLLKNAKHAVKKRNLQQLHEVCKRRFDAKAANWTYQAVARDTEAIGFLTSKSLTLPTAKDYRLLIDAWRAAAENFASKKRPSPASDWTERIADPALRMLMVTKDAEIKELRAHLALARRHQQPVNVYLGSSPPTTIAAEEPSDASSLKRLLPSEFKALRQATSADHLKSVGWTEGKHGQIIDDEGVMVLPAGFLTGLRKLLGEP